MADVALTFAAGTTGRVQPVLSGNVRPKGIDLTCATRPVSDIFWEMPLSEPFDVSEMSLTGYLWAIQHGKRWVAIPVFPGWVFACHADSLVNTAAGIERPEHLRGKRLGVPEYPVTAISWIRDAWERDNGLGRNDVTWYEERSDQTSHYRPSGYKTPAPVEQIPDDKTLCDMLIAGELDAVTRYFGGAGEGANTISVERSKIPMQELAARDTVRWLYPDRKQTALDYHRRMGWPQPIHCVIVKQDVVDQYPWVPRSLMDAFAEAADLTRNGRTVRTSFPLSVEEQQQVLGSDFSPVGLGGGSRDMVQRMLELSVKDGFMLDNRPITIEQFFHPSTI